MLCLEIVVFLLLGYAITMFLGVLSPLGSFVGDRLAPKLTERRLASVYVAYRLYTMETSASHREYSTPQAALVPYFVNEALRRRLRLDGDASAAVDQLLREYEVNEAAFLKPGDVTGDTVLVAEKASARRDGMRRVLLADGSIKEVKSDELLAGKKLVQPYDSKK
jgi:hypothetical protein